MFQRWIVRLKSTTRNEIVKAFIHFFVTILSNYLNFHSARLRQIRSRPRNYFDNLIERLEPIFMSIHSLPLIRVSILREKLFREHIRYFVIQVFPKYKTTFRSTSILL